MPDRDHYPVPPVPGPREMLTVAEFERTMSTRTQMLDAQHGELRTLVESVRALVEDVRAKQDDLGEKQDKTNGTIVRIDRDGCAARPCEQSGLRRRHVVIAGSGGVGLGAALFELVKLIGHALGVKP